MRASDATIVHANQRFTEMLGYAPDELDGRPVAEINWEDEPGEADELVARIAAELAATGEGSFQVRNRRKDGSAIWCESHVVVFDHPDHGTVWVAVQQERDRSPASERDGDERALSPPASQTLGPEWQRRPIDDRGLARGEDAHINVRGEPGGVLLEHERRLLEGFRP